MFGVGHHASIPAVESLLVGPTIEPLDLDEVRKVLKISATSEDTLIDTWISAARIFFELETGRAVMAQTWRYSLDRFPWQRQIELPRPPLQSVTAVTYDDPDGNAQTLDPSVYTVHAPAGPQCQRGRITLNIGKVWPVAGLQAQAVRIDFTAGYGDAIGDVPEIVKAALYLLVGHFYKFRAETFDATRQSALNELPLGAQAIIRSFKLATTPTLAPRGPQWLV